MLILDKVKDLVVVNSIKYFKFAEEKMYSTLGEEQNFRKVVDLLYTFIATPDKLEKYFETSSFDNFICNYNVNTFNLFDPELQLINTKPIIKYKLKEFLSDIKRFKVYSIRKKMLVKFYLGTLEY